MVALSLTDSATTVLQSLDSDIGIGWHRHARAARAADHLLNVPIADGIFTTKIDGWIHAATATTPFILRYAAETDRGLEISRLTDWDAANSAIRYAHWQAEFHWRIDTRVWQYLLYLKFMRRSYADAINGSRELDEDERNELLAVCEEFWDEVEVAYTYISEVIERSRGFAEHPDKTAGASSHGYTYRPLLEPFDFDFSELPFEMIGKEFGAGTAERHRTPPPFPHVDEVGHEGIDQAALRWVKAAQSAGLADDWLRVQLGDRAVPSRFDGWQEGIRHAMQFLEPYSSGERAQVDGDAQLGPWDLGDYAVRWGLCQAEFHRRLEGSPQQLIDLLVAQADGLRHELGDESQVGEFTQRATAVARWYLEDESRRVGDGLLPELGVVRPVHPRFASPDPLEPLPWTSRNPERYLKRMRRLGYTL